MPVTVSCNCGRRFQAVDSLAGKQVRCPGCGAVLSIPHAQSTSGPAGLPLDDLSQIEQTAMPTAPVFPSSPSTTWGAPARRKNNSRLWIVLGSIGGGVAVLLLVGAAFLFTLSSGTDDQSGNKEGASSSWRVYNSPTKHYSIKMPGEVRSRDPQYENGAPVYQEAALSSTGDLFSVIHRDISKSLKTIEPEEAITVLIDSLPKQHEIHQRRKITFGKHPAREFRRKTKKLTSDAWGVSRVYVIGKMLYILEVFSTDQERLKTDAKIFFDSFQVNENR